MDDFRLPAVAARVVAWHNRHPLARRITVAQVHAVGYVALPFVGAGFAGDAHADACVGAADEAPAVAPAPAGESGPGGGTLRERALARTRQQEAAPIAPIATVAPLDAAAPDTATPAAPPGPLQADFSENFIDPLTPRQVARFAARAGQPLARAPADGPLRVVRADGQHAGRAAVPVYLLTAAIETGIYKSRVLLGGGTQAPVLGRRIWSPPRVGTVLGVLVLCVVGLVTLLMMSLRPAAPQRVAQVLAAALAAAAPASGAAPAAADGAASASAAAEAEAPHAMPAVTSAMPASASAPFAAAADEAARVPGRGGRPSIQPPLSEQAKAAARQARNGGKPQAVAAAAAAQPSTEAMPAAAAGTSAFALSTRPLRTRAEAEQLQVAMQSLLKTVGAARMKVDVLPEGDDWRVVGWPFANRADADQARALLVSRGMRVQVVGF